jgi:hypothetical protein
MGSKLASLTLAAILMLGCDRDSSSPNSGKGPPAEPQGPRRPTTQELLSAPTKQLMLSGYPLRVTVPQSWELSELAGVPFLQGPVPSGGGIDGRTQLQISRIALPARAGEGLLADVEKERANPPKGLLELKVRALGAAKLADRRAIETRDVDGSPREVVAWTLELHLTEDATPVLYRLRFLDMSRSEYETDRVLLDRIVDSLEYTR